MLEQESRQPNTRRTNERNGTSFFNRLRRLIIGAGNTVFGADKRGIWLGHAQYDQAPFRVDMEGNVTASSLSVDALADVQQKINDGESLYTAASGLRLRISGAANAYQFVNASNVVIAELASASPANSGLGAAQLRHGAGGVLIEVSGYGEGAGQRYAVIRSEDDSTYVGLVDDDAGNFYVVMGGLPTSDPSAAGTGIVWNDGGTLKIT